MDDRRIVSDEALQQKPRASCRLAKVSPPFSACGKSREARRTRRVSFGLALVTFSQSCDQSTSNSQPNPGRSGGLI